jgi:hypothetical protein
MSIIDSVTSNCKQIAVYWGTPTNDGFGTHTYADPIEIYCRWEDVSIKMLDEEGIEFVSRAVVYVLQDVELNGLLYLGGLDDLDSDQEDDPMTITDIQIIKGFYKTPVLKSTTKFLRKAIIKPWQM